MTTHALRVPGQRRAPRIDAEPRLFRLQGGSCDGQVIEALGPTVRMSVERAGRRWWELYVAEHVPDLRDRGEPSLMIFMRRGLAG